VNLAIHVVAALLLFGIVRRTLRGPGNRPGDKETGRQGDPELHLTTSPCHPVTLSPCHSSASPIWFAAAVALLWAVHPLQTESVTYIVQRAESLVGLFYLLTLYCVIRGAECHVSGCAPRPASRIPHPPFWYAAAALAGLLGMATKEVMITAPVVVLLYDRAFLSGSFRQAVKQRWPLYAALAATWILLAALIAHSLAEPAQFKGPGFWPYLRTQPEIILHYLRLCLWPEGLCLDYQWPVANTIGKILPGMLVIGLLLAGIAWGVARRRPWGFLGAWFFIILAPTSIYPLADLAFEHRLYLPLAAVVALVVLGTYAACQRLGRWLPPALLTATAQCLLVAACLACCLLTYQRNEDYRSPLTVWSDVVAKTPYNARAHFNLGAFLFGESKLDDAIHEYEEALTFRPDYADAHSMLGYALAEKGLLDEAIRHCREAVKCQPDNAAAHLNLGLALSKKGITDEAIHHYQEALRVRPNYAKANYNLGLALARTGRFAEACGQWRDALRQGPELLPFYLHMIHGMAADRDAAIRRQALAMIDVLVEAGVAQTAQQAALSLGDNALAAAIASRQQAAHAAVSP
jgi:protein O-mannosyl-transferase